MSGHTPGPWTFGVRSDGSIWQSRGNPLEGAHYQDDFFGTVEDARLIAAAPEMLEALDETHKWVRRIQDVLTGYLVPDGYDADEALNRLLEMLDGPEQREIQGRAFAALTKATGGNHA